MQTKVLWGGLWLGSVILAWFLGSSRSDGFERTERVVTETTTRKTTGMEPRKGDSGLPSTADPGGKAAPLTDSEAKSGGVPPAPRPLDFDSLKTAEQFSEEAMAIINAHLRRGPEGHRDLMLMLSSFSEHESELEMLFAKDMSEMPKLLYPWIRLLVKREKQVVEFVDTVFETAAENPDWFKAIDGDTMVFITEAIGPILPGMTSDEIIARIRNNLQKVLQKGESALPESLAEHYEELQGLYEAWAGQLSVEEARQHLLDGSIPADERFHILKRSPAEAAAGIELAPILGPALIEDEWEAIAQLSRFKLGARDQLALDEVIYKSIAKSEYGGWIAAQYLPATDRAEWIQQRAFLEEGVRRGGKVRSSLIASLEVFDEMPDEYIHQLLALSDLTKDERTTLEALLVEDAEEAEEDR